MYYIKKQNFKKSYPYNKKMTAIIHMLGIIVLLGLLMMSSMVLENVQAETIVTVKAKGTATHQSQIAKEVLRFHVLANSDSEEDQKLKLRVKETILKMVRPMLEGVESKQEAVEILQKNMEEIEAEADKVILEEGYDYQSKGVLGKTTFPIKQYGDMVFPAGEYEAFRILLGDAKGKNWWCVMFPTLCYVDETYDVITEENKEKFREILTEEEYRTLLSTMESVNNVKKEEKEVLFVTEGEREEQTKVFYKMKSLIWLNKMIDYFQK